MRIFIIARGYPTKQNPQWGCFEKDQALALAKTGHEVVILSYRQHPFLPNIGYRVIEENGIRSISYNVLPGRLFGQHGARFRVRFEQWELTKAYQRAVELYGEPDIIYSHYLFISVIAVCLRERFHIPIVAIEHWSETNKPMLRAYVQEMGDAVYPKVNQLITVSEGTRQSILNHFKVDSVVVPNMVSDEFVYSPHESSGIVQFVSTGSLNKIKAFDVLIKAFAQVSIPKDNWHLTIIGRGEESSCLRTLINQLNLTENISLVGQKSKSEIVSIYQKSDIFVLPSRSETFGVAYIEALACGMPCVSTLCGGPEGFITKKNGLLVPINNIDKLTSAINDMYEHLSEYDRSAIAADCHAQFSSDIIAKQLTTIFEDILSAKSVQ